MKKVLIIAVGLMLLALPVLVCGSGASGNGGTSNTAAVSTAIPGPSTGDAKILNGDGCPDGFAYVPDGGSYGGCIFEPGQIYLKVYCNGEFIRNITTYESGPVWRSDSEPSERGLQVFWPGGAFACVKER